MKTNQKFAIASSLFAVFAAILLAGCATTEQAPVAGQTPSRYQATDGRSIEIGRSAAVNSGRSFKDPHMEECWIAGGFNFDGYDTLYIAPTLSTAKFPEDATILHGVTKENLPGEFKRAIAAKGIFSNVVTSESEIKSGARVLRLENTITEYSKGGGAARYFIGMYGGGQPVLRVRGKMTDGDKTVFNFEARRSGVSIGSRMVGGFMKDEDVQIDDVRSMTLDVSDFMAAIAGKYQPEK